MTTLTPFQQRLLLVVNATPSSLYSLLQQIGMKGQGNQYHQQRAAELVQMGVLAATRTGRFTFYTSTRAGEELADRLFDERQTT